MRSLISFILDDKIIELDLAKSKKNTPTTTLLNYLRSLPGHKGVKEGCAEGDCGACTVVIGEIDGNKIRYKAVDSCLIFLPMIHGKWIITVENLKDGKGQLHPVQQALVESYGSQCGFCTPGIVMSMFALYKNHPKPDKRQIDDALTGNLCRCTGYRPIAEAAEMAAIRWREDHFARDEEHMMKLLGTISKESIRIQTQNQKYYKPVSLGEAISLKHQYPEALVLHGATDVALKATKNHEPLNEIIDISGIDELKMFSDKDGEFTVGSGVTMNDLDDKTASSLPALNYMLSVFGSNQIRNLATIGGNIGSGSPIGDTLPVLMAYRSRVVLESLNGRREIPLDQFFTGYRKSARKADELVTSVMIPKPGDGAIVKSYKVSKRKGLDISTLSAGFRLELKNNRVELALLAYGGMAERVKRAENTERFLTGKNWERKTVEEAMAAIESDFTPISDARGSGEFRLKAAKNLLLKFFIETIS